jgi:hypothetical protein
MMQERAASVSRKTDRAQKGRKVSAESKNGGAIFVGRIDGDDQKNCGLGEREADGLRYDGVGGRGRSVNWIGGHGKFI